MFKPKTYLDLVMAMKTQASVNIDGVEGRVDAVESVDLGTTWKVKIQANETLADCLKEPTTVYFRE